MKSMKKNEAFVIPRDVFSQGSIRKYMMENDPDKEFRIFPVNSDGSKASQQNHTGTRILKVK